MTPEQKLKHICHPEPPRRGDSRIRLRQGASGGNRLLPAFRRVVACAPAPSADSPLEYRPVLVQGSRVSTFHGFDARVWLRAWSPPHFAPTRVSRVTHRDRKSTRLNSSHLGIS